MSESLLRRVRKRLRPLRVGVNRLRARIMRPFTPGADWHEALHGDELTFWRNALTDSERNWYPGEFEERTNPTLEVQPFVKALVPTPPGAVVRMLDVGAGPLTRLGKVWPQRTVEIVAVDPLAESYNDLLDELNILPPVRTRYALAERLLDVFPANSFDFAYASNCLDHAQDPIEAARQMIAMVKPGRFAYLWHMANAGVTECYTGLHQWNFDILHGEFIVSDGRKKISLAKQVATIAEVTCQVERSFNSRVVIAMLRKIEK